MNHLQMQPYHDLLSRILTEGVRQPNRTGIDTLTVPGAMLRFDLREGYPALTTKKLFFDAMKGELLGFFRGYDNAADFRALNCRIWDANANETQSWVESEFRKGVDDLGRIYGQQWTRWADWREIPSTQRDAYLTRGYREVALDPVRGVAVMHREMNQLEDALRKILTNPFDRRIIVNGWRPDEFDRMALPPCHVLYQFLPHTESKTLHMVMFQRSVDSALGLPFNCASAALMLALFARMTGYTAGTLTMFLADCHIYENHIEGVREMLTREHYAPPQLELSQRIGKVSADEVAGALARIEPEDIRLVNYQHHAPIKLAMAA